MRLPKKNTVKKADEGKEERHLDTISLECFGRTPSTNIVLHLLVAGRYNLSAKQNLNTSLEISPSGEISKQFSKLTILFSN